MNRLFQKSILAASVFLLTACPPRGETKNLAEVLAIAKTRFQSVDISQLEADVKQSVESLGSSLEQVLASQDAKSISKRAQSLAEQLAPLVDQAGYTSRPGLSELLTQYRGLAARDGAEPAEAAMLVARTYSAIAAELETTKFGLK